MAESPEMRLPGIARSRLRLDAGALDNPLVLLTDIDARSSLPPQLFLFSERGLHVDNQELRKYGESPSAARYEKVVRQVGMYAHRLFRVMPEVRHVVRRVDGEKFNEIHIDVEIGIGAISDVLSPNNYRRTQREHNSAIERHIALRPETIPSRELEPNFAYAGIAGFFYSVPHHIKNIDVAVERLQSLITSQQFKVGGLTVSSEDHPYLPRSLALPVRRPRALMEGDVDRRIEPFRDAS
jgi:hypothetical protein